MGRSRQTKKLQQQNHHTETNVFYNEKFNNFTEVENDTSNNEMRYSKMPENFNDDDYDRPVDIVPAYEAEQEEE